MSSELTNPLKSLLAQAAKRLPATTGETAQAQHRWAGAGSATVILCDVSGSMDAGAGGAKRKIDHLREALDATMPAAPGAIVLAFSSAVSLVQDRCLPEPSGGTAMHLALAAAAEHRPKQTIVISDGLPDSETEALAAADKLSGRIDVIYCGPDSDAAAIAFMRRLARVGYGTVVVHDVVRAARPCLAGPIRQLLALPAPGSGR